MDSEVVDGAFVEVERVAKVSLVQAAVAILHICVTDAHRKLPGQLTTHSIRERKFSDGLFDLLVNNWLLVFQTPALLVSLKIVL